MSAGPSASRPGFDRIAELFERAIAIEDPEAREAWLAELHGRDPVLGEELATLVRAHFAGTHFLDRPPAAAGAVLRNEAERKLIGERLGVWEIREVIHRGGMGTVYRADRTGADFEQSAALKVIRVGLESPRLVERFAQERRLLARLEHPGIARLLDGGTTADGLPWLAMELVRGRPIDRWCADEQAPLERVLRLFIEVCRAVHFAHGHLIVHRDIKPSNILVTDEGIPKLLDFGIAEVASAGLDEGAEPDVGGPDTPGGRGLEHAASGIPEATRALTRMRLLTPAWASPEQFRGERVGTATDIYSLGVLLYRLVSGAAPYRIDEDSTLEEAERLVCETVPSPPSEQAPPARGREGRLRPDLDAVVLKALRKDPAERYGSALSLAEDLERVLERRPVSAIPHGTLYRARRFAERNWAGLGAVAAIFLTLVGGMGSALWSASEAERQRDIARAETATAASAVDFLRTVLWSGNPFDAWDEPIETIDDVLRYAEEHIGPALGDQPAARAYIVAALAEIAIGRGDFERSARFSEEAVRLLDEDLGGEHPRAGTILRARASALRESGETETARPLALEALARMEADPATPWRERAEALNQLGTIDIDLGRHEEAEAWLRQSVAIHEATGREDPAQLAVVFNNLAGALLLQPDREEEAAAAYEEAVTLAEQSGASALALGTLVSNRAAVLWAMELREESEREYLRALDLFATVVSPAHPSVIYAATSLADLYGQTGQGPRGIELLEPVLETATSEHPADHPAIAYANGVLAAILCEEGSPADGLRGADLALAAVEARRASLPEGHWAISSSESTLGLCLGVAGRTEEGADLLAAAIEVLRRERGAEHELTLRAESRLARVRGTPK